MPYNLSWRLWSNIKIWNNREVSKDKIQSYKLKLGESVRPCKYGLLTIILVDHWQNQYLKYRKGSASECFTESVSLWRTAKPYAPKRRKLWGFWCLNHARPAEIVKNSSKITQKGLVDSCNCRTAQKKKVSVYKKLWSSNRSFVTTPYTAYPLWKIKSKKKDVRITYI